MAAYLKSRALQANGGGASECFVKCVEIQASAARDINEIATTVLRNKAIYEADILTLLDRMNTLETTTTTALKEVRKDGNPRKQKRKGNSPGGSEV